MPEQELARDLGFLEAYTIGLGTMIGAGIFVLPSIAANQAGPASMVAFLGGGIVSLLAALSLSELATGMPKAGGSYYYVNRALGPFFGSIVGWGMWAGLTFASAFYMIGFGQYLLPGLGEYIGVLSGWGEMGITVAALVMAAILTAVNYYGVKETGALQNVIVLSLVGLIVAFLGLGFLSGPSIGEFNPEGWPAVAATVGTVYVTFIGFEVIATSAEEIKNPSRNLPLAMIAAVVTPTLMYVGVMFVSTGTLPIDALATSKIPVADVAEQTFAPIANAIPIVNVTPTALGTIGSVFMIVGAVFATVSSANASILSAARVNFAMGRDRILIDWLNEVHDRFRTPYRAISVTGILTLLLIAIGVGIGTLAEVASFMYLVTYTLVHVAVVVLRRANPESYEPTFHIPAVLYPAVPIIGALACVGVLVQMSTQMVPFTLALGSVALTLPFTLTPVGAIGIVLIGFGVGWFYLYASERAPSASLVGEAIAPEEKAVTAEQEGYTVVVPVANPETERDLLRYAAASAHAHEDGAARLIAANVIEVPQQTSLEQDIAFEEERVDRQQELLEHARDAAQEFDIAIETRALVGRDAGEAILGIIEEEKADHVLVGWQGSRSTREHVLGSTIDPVVRLAGCEVTLIKIGAHDVGRTVALVGQGPHAPVAVERAAGFVKSGPDATLQLLNVQQADVEGDPEEVGRDLIEELAEEAGLDSETYEPRVLVAEEDADVESLLLSAVEEFDTVCVGATRTTSISQALFGSIPEHIGQEHDGTVAIARGGESTPRTIREALVDRLSGEDR